jgi:ketosteroid isomerase-like protein
MAPVCAEMVRAVNAGDARAYAALYAEDAVMTIHGTGIFSGRKAIEQHETELLRDFPGTRFTFSDVWLSGSTAVAHYATRSPVRGGHEVGHRGLCFFRFDASGTIAEEHRYRDGLTPMAQSGMLDGVSPRPPPPLADAMHVHVAQGSPEEQANVATVRRIITALGDRVTTTAAAGFAKDAVIDELILPQAFSGKNGAKAWMDTWRRAAPDARTEIETVLAVGEHVLLEGVLRGSLEGPLGPLPGTIGSFTAHRGVIVQLRDGEVVRVDSFLSGREIWKTSR